MSIFQCDKCGCKENTALTGGAYGMVSCVKDRPDVVARYLAILGHPPWYPLGFYCSACNPQWFTPEGHVGVGPRPQDFQTPRPKDAGTWHGKFDRVFLPKGMFATNNDGNLAHIDTLDTDTRKHSLPEEEGQLAPPRWNPWARVPVYGRDTDKEIKVYLGSRDKAKKDLEKKNRLAEEMFLEKMRRQSILPSKH